MQYVKLILSLSFIFMATCFAGCSHRPVYEKMTAVYVLKLDMRHDYSKQYAPVKYSSDDVRDDNMDLMDKLVNKEIQGQLGTQVE